MPQQPESQQNQVMKALARISNIGFRIAACVIIGVLLGKFLDDTFGTAPGLTITLALTGAGAAFKLILDSLRH